MRWLGRLLPIFDHPRRKAHYYDNEYQISNLKYQISIPIYAPRRVVPIFDHPQRKAQYQLEFVCLRRSSSVFSSCLLFGINYSRQEQTTNNFCFCSTSDIALCSCKQPYTPVFFSRLLYHCTLYTVHHSKSCLLFISMCIVGLYGTLSS